MAGANNFNQSESSILLTGNFNKLSTTSITIFQFFFVSENKKSTLHQIINIDQITPLMDITFF